MNKTLQEQYNLIKEGKGNKQQFFKSARHIFPDLVTPVNTFEDTVHILKNRGIISEAIGGLVTKGKTPDWHSIFKEKVAEAKEAKAEEKEPTKDVVDMETKGYDYKDKKNYDNVFGQEFLQGFYTEMSDSKNEGKNVEELRAIVAKNLAKDINHYAKEGQFGLKGVGYETEAPGLGTPKEAKGKHKSSGYGDLKEGKDISIKGKIVKNAKQNGDKSYAVTYEDDTTEKIYVSNDAWDDLNDKYGDVRKSLKESILRSQIHILIKEILKEKKTSINENEGMMINGKSVDIGSIEIEGIDTRDYPDFSDAYAVYAKFEDGTPLTDSELDELNDNYGDVIHELIFDNQLYLDENKKK